MFGALRSHHEQAFIMHPGFFTCFSDEKRNNSAGLHVMSMENAMRWFLESIKPTSHDVTSRHEAFSQVVLNMRDYPRI